MNTRPEIYSRQRVPHFSPTKEQQRQAHTFKVDPLIIHLLALRNISSDQDINKFLNPNLVDLPDPFTMKGMQEAVSLVADAIKNHSEIVIWGDYDVDGITATCLLIYFFESIGVEVRWNIPDRFSEGYGLNTQAIERIRSEITEEFPLLITVDCGISNHREILLAKRLGFKVVVTDHHEPPEDLVKADAIVNVKQNGCSFSDPNLAGVGIAFYLATGIRSHLKSAGYFQNGAHYPNLKNFLDFVAIGTIADMVPLTGTNRILVKAGFEVLSETAHIGLSALLQSSDITSGTLTSDDISFQVAPKINAAGRLGRVDAAMNLLLCREETRAIQFAKRLSEINVERKKICDNILESTLSINRNILIYRDNCIILSGEYHLGVIGIVASQLANIYQYPVLLFAPDVSGNGRGVLKGSGRSVPGVDLMGVLRKCDRYLIKYGGHTMAAGLSLREENLGKFKQYFSEILEQFANDTPKQHGLPIDAEFPVEKIFEGGLPEQLNRMEPFGIGNTRPIFSDTNAYIYDYQTIGRNGDHLKLFFRGKYANRKGLGFNLGHKNKILQQQRNHTVIYSPILNRYKKALSWELRLLDIL